MKEIENKRTNARGIYMYEYMTEGGLGVELIARLHYLLKIAS